MGMGLGQKSMGRRERVWGRRPAKVFSRPGDSDSRGGESTSQRAEESRDTLKLKAVALLGCVGAAETAYLTISKWLSANVVCPTSGCDTILTSKYSELYGLPVSLYGFLAYAGVGFLAWQAANTERRPGNRIGMAVVAGSTVLSTVSAYLGYILFTQFTDEACIWCLASILISFSVFVLALSATAEGDPIKTSMPPMLISPILLTALVYSFGDANFSLASEREYEVPFKEPEVNTTSSERSIALVKNLNKLGAKMYGSFWCSHCFDQKQVFGKEAMVGFPYVECFPDGYRKGMSQSSTCEEADVRGYPTWTIKGERIEGDQTLDVLEALVDKYKDDA